MDGEVMVVDAGLTENENPSENANQPGSHSPKDSHSPSGSVEIMSGAVKMHGAADAAKPRARRRWTRKLDLLLLKEVASARAHVAQHGEGQKRYVQVAMKLNENTQFNISTDWKHAKDRFMLLMRKHKKDEGRNVRESRIEEEYDEFHQLLTVITLEVEDGRNEVAACREEESRRQENARQKGIMIRSRETHRQKRSLPTGTPEAISEPGTEQESSEKRRRRQSDSFSTTVVSETIVRLEESRREFAENYEARLAELDARFAELEERREARRAELDARLAELEERREARRAELEKRREARQEKCENRLLELLEKLTEKVTNQ